MWRPLPPPYFATRRIATATANYFGISVSDLKSPSREHNVTVPRQMAMMLIRERTKRTFPQIGEYFNRDHTTCIHAFYSMKERVCQNADLREHYDAICGLIDGTINFAQATLPHLRELNVCEQQRGGEGEVPDSGVQELEGGSQPDAELPAPTPLKIPLPYQYPYRRTASGRLR